MIARFPSFLLAASVCALCACGATYVPPKTAGTATGGSSGASSSTTGSTGSTTGASSTTSTSTSTTSTTSSTTSSGGSTGASGLACQACSTNADCASNSCYQGHCDATGPNGTCSSDADCGGGVCHQYSSGKYCECPSGTSTTTGGTTTGGGTTGTSGTTGAGTTGSCTPLTWSNFGQGFFNGNCNGCHNFDHSTVQSDPSYIQSKIDSGDMPRGSTLSSSDKSQIDQYLSCGAP